MITAAALIMIAVFIAFVADPDPVTKTIGLGLAVAVLVDATVVRMVLVPALMVLMGRANWWLPRWLDRVLPHIHVEGPEFPSGPTPDDTTPTPPVRRQELVSAGR